jgi:glycosyltransferase involved in cell wall biosynthesis
MRVVQIIDTLEVGGLERFAVDLAREQKRTGQEPYLYCLLGGGCLADEARTAGLPVRIFGKTRGFSGGLLMRLAQQLRRDAPDVVHTHNPGVHPYGAVAARLAGVPAVLNTRHGVTTSTGRLNRERYFRAAGRLTDRIVFVSEHCCRVLTDRGLPYSKARVIHNGIDLAPFSRPATPGAERPRIRFVTVGRLVPVKAHDVLLAAFAALVRRLPDASLRIVGAGPLLDDTRAHAARLGLAGNVTLEGESRDVATSLRASDIFVLSSTSEGLPLAILEAMAAGLPIVSTRVGGVPEVAPEGEVAWYCEPGSARDLTAAMFAAATCQDLPERGKAARRIVCARYSIVRAQQDYDSLYREVLATRAHG